MLCAILSISLWIVKEKLRNENGEKKGFGQASGRILFP